MSIWTHVAGVIRIDTIFPFKENAFEEIMGKTLLFETPHKTWEDVREHPDRYTPYGSEGGIQYSVWEDPDESSVAKYTVSVFGDLRDYSNTKKIEEWFKSILYDKDLVIRDAILHVVCDDGEESVVKYDWELAEELEEEREKSKNDG